MHGRTNGTSWPFSLPGVISAGVLYGFVYAGIRLAISHNLPQDDVTSNILAQTLVARCKFHIPKEGQALHVFLARSAFGSKQTRTLVRA